METPLKNNEPFVDETIKASKINKFNLETPIKNSFTNNIFSSFEMNHQEHESYSANSFVNIFESDLMEHGTPKKNIEIALGLQDHAEVKTKFNIQKRLEDSSFNYEFLEKLPNKYKILIKQSGKKFGCG